MGSIVDKRIARLADAGSRGVLVGGLKGIEKESLRVFRDGRLADTPHPERLGSALTNRYITTDFSEALLEFVTPAAPATWQSLETLCEIHQFTYERIGDELLWVTSMPCLMAENREIPLAQYGSSNVGRMKTIYRNGLGYRYGRRMQTIAGVHFNYSLPETFWPHYQQLEKSNASADAFRSDAYLGLVRNFRRFGWLILYLFGASPALCKSFFAGRETDLEHFNESTFFAPHSTSLRMSDLGYSNNSQARINISLNSLDEYIHDLRCAICTPEPSYEAIGVLVDGSYRQLSANRLQIENEYYSPIRPKRVAMSGERPTAALLRGGIEYVEVRSLDLNVFDPVGINQNVMRFTEAFLIYCMLEESPLFDDANWFEMTRNHGATARDGRNPQFMLLRDGKDVPMRVWADEILDKVRAIAELIDGGAGDYVSAVDAQAELVADPGLTPSARVLADMRDAGTGFYHFAMEAAIGHRDYFASLTPMEPDRVEHFENEARASLQRQRDVEAADTMTFEEYLAKYYSDQGCC